MSAAAEFDAITQAQLEQIGGLKWSRFPGKIGAFVAESDFPLAPPVAERLHTALRDGFTGYMPAHLGQSMSAACADWQRDRYGWHVPTEWVRPIGDVVTAFRATIQHFSAPGSKIIVPTPAYMPFLVVPQTLGREVIEVPMLWQNERWELDLDGIAQAFADGGGLLTLCNPYNPVGRVFTRPELEAVRDVVDAANGRVFSDEIHAPLVYAPHAHIPYASIDATTAEHTVTSTSASKAWNLPGLKAAQLILSNERDADTWSEVGMMLEHGASTFGVLANEAAYVSGGEWLDQTVAYLDGNRRRLGELLTELIPEMGYAAPEGTYVAWLDARRLGIDGSPAEFFRDFADVVMTDGRDCGIAGEGHLRFILAMPRPILERAVRQMADALSRR